MRLIIMGTGPFAEPTFQALYKTRHFVVALVTQPRRAVRGRDVPPAPLRDVAVEHGTPILEFENINTREAQSALLELQPDLFVVADYGQILSSETLAVARFGGVNLHGSLLPKYRGAAPINWAIYHGEPETGVTTIHMTPHLDAGPALAQARVTIGPEEDAVQLEQRLAALGAPLVVETIALIEQDSVEPLAQDSTQATKARRLKKSDGEIDWSRSAVQIKNQIRALQPWPKTYTYWRREGKAPLRLIIEQVHLLTEPPPDMPQGTIYSATSELLAVATGNGGIALDRIQPVGKRVLPVAEFLRGYPLSQGDQLGSEMSP